MNAPTSPLFGIPNITPEQLAAIAAILNPGAALPSPTVAELCEKYLSFKATRSRPHGFRSTKARLRAVVALLGDKPATKLTHDDADTFIATRKACGLPASAAVDPRVGGRKRQAKGVSQCTAASEIQALITVLRWAQRRRLVTDNPLSGLEIVLDKGKRERTFSREEIAAILDAAKRLGLGEVYAVTSVMAGSGIRPKELLSTRIENVDLAKRLINVPAAIAKTGKARQVALLPEGAAAMAKLIGKRREGPVFRQAYTTFNGHWRKCVDFAGIAKNKNGTRAQTYSLRHTLATRLAIELGFGPFELCAAMGWSNPAQAATYVKTQETALLSSATKLQAANEAAPLAPRPRVRKPRVKVDAMAPEVLR